MSKSLVIVESNTKTKTIAKFLGKDYEILSSVGHIKDLPKRRLGVDVENHFEPDYITIRGKGKILNQLKKSALNADHIYIATDPDREGEAIAFHLAEEIKSNNKNIYRILFNEITEKAVKQAISAPTKIDINKVSAQKARRVVDRLVGYQISPVLWRTVYRGLSAGRVQSVALRLIVEREAEIDKFIPQEYWSITAQLQAEKSQPFYSRLIKIDGKPPELKNESETKAAVAELKKQTFQVKEIKKKKVTRQPAPPFTTSTMQQTAANRLGYSSKKIMMIAQQLYEGIELGTEGSVGLITYMRTDSTRISEEALMQSREYILVNYGNEYVPAKARRFKVKSGAQDAHEAIRPTLVGREPKKIKKYLTAEQFKLYELIWKRFVASQMKETILEQTTVDITAGEKYLFRTTGSVILFRGFLQVYEEYVEENGQKSDFEEMRVPRNISKGEILTLLELLPKQHFTKPPPRYTESSLIKELDNLGIGRPSTYALIVVTIITRKYVEKQKRQLVPTELGKTVNKILTQNFPDLINVKFTAQMEENLDKIESGKKRFLEVAENFYVSFKKALDEVDSKKDKIKDSLQEETQEKCPKCGREMIIRWGRNGKFMACSGYPECKHTKPLEKAEEVTATCDKCGRNMVIKYGRFGRFLACSGYPECKNTQPISIGVNCPQENCSGVVVEKRSRRGRSFYGCSKYPDCKFATWNRPVNMVCKNCSNKYLEQRSNQSSGDHLYCPVCKQKFPLEDKESYREVAYG